MPLKERAVKLKRDIPTVFLCLNDNETPLPAKLFPADVRERNRIFSENLWFDGKPKKWYYALPIVAVWLLVPWVILRAFFF